MVGTRFKAEAECGLKRSASMMQVCARPWSSSPAGTVNDSPVYASRVSRVAAPATVAGAATLDTLDAYTGLSFTVPAELDDQGRAQTCIIDADLFKPHSASALNRVPTILTTNGFGGSKADQSGLGRAFAQRGYAVLPPRVLGSPTRDARSPGRPIHRRRSRLAPGDVPGWRCQGDMRLFANSRRPGRGRHGGCDLQQELDNAAAHDPRVGMIGGSY